MHIPWVFGRVIALPGKKARMVVRTLTAFAGGYAATSGVAALAARLLPIDRVEATGWAMILSFLLYAALLLWAFHEARLGRVVAVIWGLPILCAATVWLIGTRP